MPGIFQSVNHTSDIQLPAFELKMDTSSILVNLQKTVNQKPRFRRPMTIKYFFLVLWCKFAFCRIGHAFFLQPIFSFKILYVFLPSPIRATVTANNTL